MIIGIIILSVIYVILYQNIIGGCLLASLFVLVLISWWNVRRKASKLRIEVSLDRKAASRKEEIQLKGIFKKNPVSGYSRVPDYLSGSLLAHGTEKSHKREI